MAFDTEQVDLIPVTNEEETKNKVQEALIAALTSLSTQYIIHPDNRSDALLTSIVDPVFNSADNIISVLPSQTLLNHMRDLKKLKTQEKAIPFTRMAEKKLLKVSPKVLDRVLEIAERKFLASSTSATSVASSSRNLLLASPRPATEFKPDEQTPVTLLRVGAGFLAAAAVVSFIATITPLLYPLFALSGMCVIIGGGLMLTAYGMHKGNESLWEKAFPGDKNSSYSYNSALFF